MPMPIEVSLALLKPLLKVVSQSCSVCSGGPPALLATPYMPSVQNSPWVKSMDVVVQTSVVGLAPCQ
jgi:hypothetical protein